MRNLLLLHLREQRRLTPEQICRCTGIPPAIYRGYENTPTTISATDTELLSALLRVKPAYLQTYSHQLEYFAHCAGLLALRDEKIRQLTRALKGQMGHPPRAEKALTKNARR